MADVKSKQHTITLVITTELHADLLRWCADHIEELTKGEQLGIPWAVREILRRYFVSQKTMQQVLRAGNYKRSDENEQDARAV